MTARPGRVFTELAIDAPYPRGDAFRTSPEYAAFAAASPKRFRGSDRRARHERVAARHEADASARAAQLRLHRCRSR